MGSVAINKSTMNILKTRSWEIGAVLALAIAISTIFLIPLAPAHANPFRFPASAATSAATTSPVYMTPGTATTTVTYDSYANGGGSQATDKATLLMQMTASSTSTTYNVALEYSQDGIDWYSDSQLTGTLATTTQVFQTNTPISYSIKYASTTPDGGIVLANSNTAYRALTIPTPTRFVRVFSSLAVGGTNGATWLQIIGQKQSN